MLRWASAKVVEINKPWNTVWWEEGNSLDFLAGVMLGLFFPAPESPAGYNPHTWVTAVLPFYPLLLKALNLS